MLYLISINWKWCHVRFVWIFCFYVIIVQNLFCQEPCHVTSNSYVYIIFFTLHSLVLVCISPIKASIMVGLCSISRIKLSKREIRSRLKPFSQTDNASWFALNLFCTRPEQVGLLISPYKISGRKES